MLVGHRGDALQQRLDRLRLLASTVVSSMQAA